MNLSAQLTAAREASRTTALLSTAQKNSALQKIAEFLRSKTPEILEENARDMAEGEKNNLGSMLDRLMLNAERIEAIARDTEKVAELKDFVGETVYEYRHENGLKIEKVRVPVGVVAMIYEARPNVTVDAAVLALKSGNAIVLKGGKEAAHSNRVLVKVMRAALENSGLDSEALQLLDGATREDTAELLRARGQVDILIPRGSNKLIKFVHENSTVPVIETGASPVHTFVDESADLDVAVAICVNEKVRRVSVCNALDTILIHENVAVKFLQKLAAELTQSAREKGHPEVVIHADEPSFALLENASYQPLEKLNAADYDTEWLDYALSTRVVKDLDEALTHIREHSLGHSESIITNDAEHAARFLNEVDAACVYHNASTCFSDGGEFGLGAEIGISTQKLHARGPFALEALTSWKWVVRGEGQVRN